MTDAATKAWAGLLLFSDEYLVPFIEENPRIAIGVACLVGLRTVIWIVTLFCFQRLTSGWPAWPRVLTSRFSQTILIRIPGILTPYRLALALIPLRLVKMLGVLAICTWISSFYPYERWLRAFNGYRWPLFGGGVVILTLDRLFLIPIARSLLPGRVDVLIMPRRIIVWNYFIGIPFPKSTRWDPSRHDIKSHTMPHSRSNDPEETVFRDGHVVVLSIGAATVALTTIIGRQFAEQIAHLFSSPVRDLLQKQQAGVDRSRIITTALDYGTQTPKAE